MTYDWFAISIAGFSVLGWALESRRRRRTGDSLAALVNEWRNRVEPGSDAATWYMAADEIEALLEKHK